MKAVAASPGAQKSSAVGGLGRVVQAREVTLFGLIVAVIVAMSFLSPYFLSLANFRALSIGMVPTGIIVIGMTLLLVSGGFDLSVGSVLALTGTVLALLVVKGVAIPVALLGSAAVGALIGLVNGILVTRVAVNPLVATLGTLSAARGFALVLTEGFSISGLPPSFGIVGSTDVLGVPLMVIIMVALVVVADLALRHTRALRQLYFIGANETAARLSGIAVDRVRTAAYIASGVPSHAGNASPHRCRCACAHAAGGGFSELRARQDRGQPGALRSTGNQAYRGCGVG